MEKTKKVKDRVFFKVLNYVSSRPRSRYETESALNRYLQKEEITKEQKSEVKEYVIKSLEDGSSFDDLDVANQYVQSAINSSKPKSRRALYAYLKRKGISTKVINKSLQNFTDEIELQNIERELDKKFNGVPKSKADTNDAWKYLLRKGYQSRLISQILNAT